MPRFGLAISPLGRVRIHRTAPDAAEVDSAAATRIEAAFERGWSHGVLNLGASELETSLPASAAWFRELGKRFVAAVCASPDLEEQRERGRGRTYARNGSVLDLRIVPGEVTALVQGSSLYRIRIGIRALEKSQWNSVVERCSGQIGSLVELLRGRISDEVMRVVTEPSRGLFPVTKEIELNCSCPDGASMCKHVAAALYGVGARLDTRPELLFTLRGTDAGDLVTDAAVGGGLVRVTERRGTLAGTSLSELFGIEIEEEEPSVPATRAARPSKSTPSERARKNTRLDDRIVALLESTPGLGGLPIARALGVPFADIVQPIKRLLASKRLRTTGALRAIRYSPSPAAPANSATRRASPPPATKRPRPRKSR